ncbi:MAG: aldehyde dehydrogenase family protein [Myxococcales bacterium]|nr:aldehyde dehydrogenase family protein [Myxococcales bacterium]
MSVEAVSATTKLLERIECFDPATGAYLGEVAVTTPDEVRSIVSCAREAHQLWRNTDFSERRRVLRMLMDQILRHADELVELIVRDAGKTRENAMLGEIWPVCEKIRATIATGERHLRPERVSSGLLVHKQATIEYHPLGVIGVICPWNYPLQNVLGPVIPALFSGNASVVKVSEWTSWSAARIQKLFDDVFDAAGYPRELVTLITGYGPTGAALVGSGVDKVVFTGSMRNGQRVLAESAKTLTPVILELGGKDAMIVCDDADLEQAVHAALAGVFIAAGQNCLAAERLLVFDGIYDAFVARVTEEARGLRQGDPLGDAFVDVGAMTMPGQVAIVEALVNDAVERGARAVVGGRRGEGPGSFFQPTILVDVPDDARILHEETFGPVMVVVRVASEEDAVRRANETEYGLASTVLSRDARRAKRIADQIIAGATCVNDFALTYMAQELPFGGVRGSGFGRLNGREGLRAMCNVKSVMTDRFPLHQPAKLYPVKRGDYETAKRTIEMLYSDGLVARAKALWKLIRGA